MLHYNWPITKNYLINSCGLFACFFFLFFCWFRTRQPFIQTLNNEWRTDLLVLEWSAAGGSVTLCCIGTSDWHPPKHLWPSLSHDVRLPTFFSEDAELRPGECCSQTLPNPGPVRVRRVLGPHMWLRDVVKQTGCVVCRKFIKLVYILNILNI